jgi:Na+/H+ antiporter NhaD/arsenite permease-like protein
MSIDKIIVLIVFIVCYTLALTRKVKLAYASLGASVIFILIGIIDIKEVVCNAIKWDVLGIYWGFMMVSFVFMKSRMPEVIANKIIETVKVEKYILVWLCGVTALLSAFMENVGIVLMMAPVAFSVAHKLNSSPFYYLISIAISSNVSTTVTMVADPPPIILAMETGMKPLDFYWFHGRPGLGTLSLLGVIAALLTLLIQFRWMNKHIDIVPEKVKPTKSATVLFICGVCALAICPEFGIRVGIVGLTVGLIALYIGRRYIKEMFVEFDWNSFLFIVGVFIVIYTVDKCGLLKDFANGIVTSGITEPNVLLAFIVWLSVMCSSFMDNVPYTILMIPVCKHIAELVNMSAWPLLYGMIVGTGTGGNITPVGAAANVFACGELEKRGYKVRLKDYLKIGVPFSVVAVGTIHILIHIFWMR